jgi:hypothetical protein
MNTYVTLFDEKIDLTLLSLSWHRLVCQLIGLMERTKGEHAAGAATSFSEKARQLIRSEYPSRVDYDSVMRSPVGKIYRDSFYRFFITEVAEDDRRWVRQRLHFSPLRLLLDRFLDGWDRQAEFAGQANLDPASVSRAFSYLLKHGAETAIGADRLEDAYQRLAIVPALASRARYFPAETDKDEGKAPVADPIPLLPADDSNRSEPDAQEYDTPAPLLFASVLPSVRDWQLWTLIPKVVIRLSETGPLTQSREQRLTEVREQLAFNLAMIYGISDVLDLTRLTDKVLVCVLETLRGPREPIESRLAGDEQEHDLTASNMVGPLFFEKWIAGEADLPVSRESQNVEGLSGASTSPAVAGAGNSPVHGTKAANFVWASRALASCFGRSWRNTSEMIDIWRKSALFDVGLKRLSKGYVAASLPSTCHISRLEPRSDFGRLCLDEAVKSLPCRSHEGGDSCSCSFLWQAGKQQEPRSESIILKKAMQARYLDETYCACVLSERKDRSSFLPRLKVALERLEDKRSAPVEEFAEADFDFHREILTLAGYCWKVQGLREGFLLINTVLKNPMTEDKRPRILEDHRRIYAAIEHGNPYLIGQAYVRHFQEALASKLELPSLLVEADKPFAELMRMSNYLQATADFTAAQRQMRRDDLFVWCGKGVLPLEEDESIGVVHAEEEEPTPAWGVPDILSWSPILRSSLDGLRDGSHFVYLRGRCDPRFEERVGRIQAILGQGIAKPDADKYVSKHVLGRPCDLSRGPLLNGDSYALVFLGRDRDASRIAWRHPLPRLAGDRAQEPEEIQRQTHVFSSSSPRYGELGRFMIRRLLKCDDLPREVRRKAEQAEEYFKTTPV